MSVFIVLLTPSGKLGSRNGPGWRVAAAEAQLRLPLEDASLHFGVGGTSRPRVRPQLRRMCWSRAFTTAAAAGGQLGGEIVCETRSTS